MESYLIFIQTMNVRDVSNAAKHHVLYCFLTIHIVLGARFKKRRKNTHTQTRLWDLWILSLWSYTWHLFNQTSTKTLFDFKWTLTGTDSNQVFLSKLDFTIRFVLFQTSIYTGIAFQYHVLTNQLTFNFNLCRKISTEANQVQTTVG